MYKIMIAEDDGAIREELTVLLRANGYSVVAEPPCDLALLDVNLPGENGFELRSEEHTSELQSPS